MMPFFFAKEKHRPKGANRCNSRVITEMGKYRELWKIFYEPITRIYILPLKSIYVRIHVRKNEKKHFPQ